MEQKTWIKNILPYSFLVFTLLVTVSGISVTSLSLTMKLAGILVRFRIFEIVLMRNR